MKKPILARAPQPGVVITLEREPKPWIHVDKAPESNESEMESIFKADPVRVFRQEIPKLRFMFPEKGFKGKSKMQISNGNDFQPIIV